MNILVANLGSTSFKYRLFDMRDERQLARGGIERIGAAESRSTVEIWRRKQRADAGGRRSRSGGAACLEQLTDPEMVALRMLAKWRRSASRRCTAARCSGVQRVTPAGACGDGGR